MRESRPRESTPRECALPDGLDARAVLLEVLGAVNVASREHIYRHYDSEVRGCTVVRPGEADAGVIAPIPGAGVGVAVACDGNPFYGAVDPYQAGAVAVAESVRNVAAVGAHPLALTDCLNFGSPEVPEVFHDFVEAVRGIGDAARGIGLKDSGEPIPVVSGNVSFYNQSSGGSAVLPSPIVCCVGRLVDVSRHLTMGLEAGGNSIYLLGRRTAKLGASALLRAVAGDQVAAVPEVDFDDERRMMVAVTDIAESGLAASCHDISDGGVAVALAEMVLSSPQDDPVGARVSVQRLNAGATGASGTTHDLELLFSEAGGYLLEAAPVHDERLLNILEDRGVWYSRIGTTVAGGGLSFTETADGDFSLSAEELARPWTDGATEVMR
jgi:phosphoribosylformylglycinamidine synthase